MEKSKSIGVAVIELLGSAFWPALALLAIVIFRPHVESLLQAAAVQVKNATTIKVGSVDITVSKDSIPKPPLRIANVLPTLDTELMEYVLENSPDLTSTNCYAGKEPSDLAEDGQITRLAKLNLIHVEELKNYKDENNKKCERAVQIKFDDMYSRVRTYYFDVLKAIKFTEAK